MIQPYSLFFVSFLLLSSFVSAQRGLKKGKEKSEALTTRYSDFDVSIDSFEEQKPRSKGGVKGVKGAKGTKGTTGNNLDATGTRDGPSNSLTLTLVNQSYKQSEFLLSPLGRKEETCLTRSPDKLTRFVHLYDCSLSSLWFHLCFGSQPRRDSTFPCWLSGQ
jgi:hypothetical protein